MWRLEGYGFTVDGGLEIRACHCDQRRLVEPQFRTEQRDFQGRCIKRVSNDRVRKTKRLPIHRPRDGDSAILIAPSAAVLNGGEEAWTNDGQPTARRSFPVAQAFMACAIASRLSSSANLMGSRDK
jgi:hypothetical protein